jgi:hypothetical protein
MNKWRISVFAGVYCLTIFSMIDAVESRFLRVVRQFKNAAYSATDRDLLVDFSYDAQSDNKGRDAEGLTDFYDDESNFHRSIDGKIAAVQNRLKGSVTTQESRNIEIGFTGNFNEDARTKSNRLLSMADTVQESTSKAELYASYRSDYERHFGFKRCKGLPFWSLGSSVRIAGNDQRNSKYSTGTIERTFPISKKAIVQSAELYLGVKPEIGYGRPNPVWPVYYAFEVERKLKECGALRGELSDKTLLAIANQCASMEAYRVNYDKSGKFFMAALDSIIRTDTMADLSHATMYTSFKVREAVDNKFPYFFAGFHGALYLNQYVYSIWVKRRNIDNVNLQWTNSVQQPESEIMIDQSYSYGVSLQWGIPITARTFGSIRTEMPIYGNGSEETVIRDKRNFWGIDLFWFITDRLLVSGTIADLPAIVIVPCDWPRNSSLEARYFIEDRISINLTLSKSFSNNDGADLFKEKDHTNHVLHDYIKLGFDYDF